VVLLAESICILVGMLSLIAGYIQFNLFPIASGCFIVGSLWLLLLRRRFSWVASSGMIVFGFAAGMGAWIGLSPVLMACSVLGNLLAWDLDDFSRRLQRAAPEDNLRQLGKMHILRLILMGGVGLSLILVASFIHLWISFGWMFLLALVAILGMVQMVNHLRRGG
jgi:hypothetical protein